jgi:hypothetical protein
MPAVIAALDQAIMRRARGQESRESLGTAALLPVIMADF